MKYPFIHLGGKAVLVVAVEKLKPMAEIHSYSHKFRQLFVILGVWILQFLFDTGTTNWKLLNYANVKYHPNVGEKLLKQHMGGNEKKEDTRICVQTYII